VTILVVDRRCCVQCGARIVGRPIWTKYCGAVCSAAAAVDRQRARRHDPEPRPAVRLCAYCEVVILGRGSNAVYCSPWCSHRMWVEIVRERRRERTGVVRRSRLEREGAIMTMDEHDDSVERFAEQLDDFGALLEGQTESTLEAAERAGWPEVERDYLPAPLRVQHSEVVLAECLDGEVREFRMKSGWVEHPDES
jgi:hypothetical protein